MKYKNDPLPASKRHFERLPAKKMECPTHHIKLVRVVTRHGHRWNCPIDGCTVRCWEGSTSTPANQETCEARHRAHAAFDPLWRTGGMRRKEAYSKLAYAMGMHPDKCHIGMMNKAQAEQVIAICANNLEPLRERPKAKVFIWINGHNHRGLLCDALAEDGTALVRGYLATDHAGFREGMSGLSHIYSRHYPSGFELVEIPEAEIETHPGLACALEQNRQMAATNWMDQ